MKKRYITLLLFSASLSMTSCISFSFQTARLSELKIADENTSYLIGQTYFNDNALTISGKYTDETTKEFTLEDVVPSLTCSGTSYNIKKAFNVPGEYTLSVTKDGVKSNSITFTVFEETQYVTSMEVTGASETYTGGITTLTLNVNPTYFTVPITATVNQEDLATVTKINKTQFQVSASKVGSLSVTFSAKTSETETIQVVHNIVISKKETVDMAYTYEDVRKNFYYNTPGFPLSGTPKILIVPVWFTDSGNYIKSSYKNNVIADIRKAYFGSTSETGWHSVSSFYKEESCDALEIQGTVANEWYNCNLSSTTVGEYTNSNNIAVNAADWYFSKYTSDSRSNYDANNDGYIDSIMLIYAAADSQIVTSLGENMWAYCFWVQDQSQKSTSNPGVNTYFWASYDFMYGSNKAYGHTGNNYANGDTSNCEIDAHTYIHEMGHVLGLDDYYDYSKTDTLNPAGGFSMQDNNVGGHDAFSATAFGWTNVYIPNESCELTLADFQESRQVVLLTPSWNSYNSPFDEYVLLELYAPTGLNQFDSQHQYCNRYPIGPSAAGIRLWHVDARLYRNGFTSNASLQGIRIAFNNTSKTSEQGGRTCEAGAAYQNLNLLTLIRNNPTATLQTKTNLSNTDLFRAGDSFSQSTFSDQFPNGNTLDNGVALGWSFTVNSILTDQGIYKATISFTKL